MASSLNKVTLIGNLGGDPEFKGTQDGRAFANFSMATTEYWKDKGTGEFREKTEWHRVVVFNERLVEVVRNSLKKGTKVYVEGKIETRKYIDNKAGGVEKSMTEIVLQQYQGNIVTLEKRDVTASPGGQTSSYPPSGGSAPSSKPPFDDEIPF